MCLQNPFLLQFILKFTGLLELTAVIDANVVLYEHTLVFR